LRDLARRSLVVDTSAAVAIVLSEPGSEELMRQQEMTARWPGRWRAGLIMAG
jgi:hypothetical protein